MIGRPLRIDWQADDTPAALKAAYRAEEVVSVRTRLHALWLIRRGWPIKAAAEAVGVAYRSAQRRVAWDRDGGLAAVVSRRMGGGGQPRFLSAAQEGTLVEAVGSGRFRTAGEIGAWVESADGVRFKGNRSYRVLDWLGCSPQVPRGRHEQADVSAQKRWKRGAWVGPC